jgi:lycopene beta-cyclase
VKADVVLVGGGLANALVALRLATLRPELSLLVLEQEPRLGGSHTWSFHDTDVEPAQLAWLEPLVAGSWPAYDVRFPGLERRIASGYRSITSTRLDEVLSRRLGDRLRLGCAVVSVRAAGVTLDDGTEIEASCVIDGRGARPLTPFALGFQKFLGRELRFARPHGRALPTLMDATVEQRFGFRFFYTLPLAEDTLLVEDTAYSEDPRLDRVAARAAIGVYVERLGLPPGELVREEEGLLPIPLGGDIEAFWHGQAPGVACSGMRAALFHPTTGYALPEAVRLADALAALAPLTSGTALALVRARSLEHWRRTAFYRFLNRMLFRAAAPAEAWRVLERFYRLPEGLILRFYAGRPTLADRIRLLSGRPPVPVARAARCVLEPVVTP